MNKLILIRGIPGSGKSTLAKQYQSLLNYKHHEADHFFEKSGTYQFNPKLLKQAHQECYNKTKQDLLNGHNVVVSNTFTTKQEIQPYINLANELNIPHKIIHTKGNFKSIHEVPEHTINKMKSRWENI